MTRGALMPRERRVLAWGAAVMVAIVLLGRVLPAWRAWERETLAGAAEIEGEAARATATVQRAGQLPGTLKAHEGRLLALAPLLLDGETPAVGSATLASIVSGAAAASSVRIGSVQLQHDSGGKTFTHVSVRAEATGDVQGITTFLQMLERGPSLLAVHELTITQALPAAAADRMEALKVDLLVEGLMLTPRAKKAGR
jgi:hypothetical protein